MAAYNFPQKIEHQNALIMPVVNMSLNRLKDPW